MKQILQNLKPEQTEVARVGMKSILEMIAETLCAFANHKGFLVTYSKISTAKNILDGFL